MRKLSIGLLCLLAALQSGAGLRAQSVDWNWAVHGGLTKERILGLIDVTPPAGSKCDSETPMIIKLYDTPSATRPATGQIELGVASQQPAGSPCAITSIALRRAGARSAEPTLTEESGYEIPALIAYERAGRWFRIALPRGSAWMRSTNPEHFHQYPELLRENLAFMTDGWDGRLWSTPGASSARAVSPESKRIMQKTAATQRESGAEVLAIRRMGKETWIQVRVTDGECGDLATTTIDTGWVPAYRPTGKPSVWFYSRGC